MIIKDIYLKKAKLNSLNGAIIFFTNEKFEINIKIDNYNKQLNNFNVSTSCNFGVKVVLAV